MARGVHRHWYQPNKYYERPIRIQLRSLSTFRRKRPWRPRDFSLCDLFPQCCLIHLAICADSSENLCAWSRGVRSVPHDYDTAFFTELIQLDGLMCRNEYAKYYSRSHGAVIRVYGAAGNVIEMHDPTGDFKKP